jgi:glutaconate CoA-transferase subunit A
MMSTGAAVDLVKDGATISIGGFINSSHPMQIVRELIRRRVRDLTVVGAASSGLELDMLIAAGCAHKVIAPYVGAEKYAAVAPAFRAAAQAGEIEVWELDEALYYAGLRAASQRVPFNPWLAGVGTSFPEVNQDLKVFEDPIEGKLLLAVPAINIDVAFVHAAVSDTNGNVQYVGHGYGDRAHYYAAAATIAQVERVVSEDEIRRAPERTALPGVHGVVRAPYGAHPFASPGHYREDANHLREYVAAATAWLKANDRSPLEEYFEQYIYGASDDAGYLERVGIRTLLQLWEY